MPNTRLDFGSTRVNDHSGGTRVSVTNRGGGPLSIASVTLDDDLNYRVEGVPSSPLTLQPGGVLELTVFFEPKKAGTVRATLTITSDAEASPLENHSERQSFEVMSSGRQSLLTIAGEIALVNGLACRNSQSLSTKSNEALVSSGLAPDRSDSAAGLTG